jgi:hypothetical protein
MRIPAADIGRRSIIRLLFGASLIAIIAACASGAASAPGQGGAATVGSSAARAAPAASSASSRSVGGSSSDAAATGDQVALIDDAKIVRTGSLGLEVSNVAAALTAGRDAIRSVGGYVGASQQQREGDDIEASVTYRIPVARWEEALDALALLGTVVSETTDATEVTDQIVDLDARIRNLKASEQALVGYAEKAPKVSDLLEIQSRLTETRGEIERLTAQQANLTDRAALATLTVSYGTKSAAVVQASERWDPAAEVDRASATLISVGQAVVSFAIVFAIVWLPILVVLGFIVIVGLLVARRLGIRRSGPPAIAPPAVSPPA